MKALFFLRHYNDIDHITPVIYKWIDSGHTCDIVVIGNSRFRNDYRIEFLRKLTGVRMAYIGDLLPPVEFVRWFLQTLILIRSLRRPFLAPLMAALTHAYDARRRDPVMQSRAQSLRTHRFGGTPDGLVVVDWLEKNSTLGGYWGEIAL